MRDDLSEHTSPSASGLRFRLGADRLIEDCAQYIKAGERVGLLAHAASVLADGRHIAPALKQALGSRLIRLFSPEHGIFGAAQDMIGVDEAVDPLLHLPVKSLYGESESSLWPNVADLNDLDVLVIDLQDIGSRYYTYIYTMAFCMARAKEAGTRVIVCDRPNPLGGSLREGREQDRAYCSFVGWYPLPVRHGMTIAELALHFNQAEGIGADVSVIPMEGWNRGALGIWPDLGPTRLWINPSPNMPTLEAALVYPGACLIEGTNLSEGRGTTRPFEWIGAPFIDSTEWIDALRTCELPGVHFLPWTFQPMFQKWSGKTCHGVQMVVEDPNVFLPYRTGCAMIYTAAKLYPKQFAWRTETYEFVSDRLAIDLLTGSPRFRTGIESGDAFNAIMDDIGMPLLD